MPTIIKRDDLSLMRFEKWTRQELQALYDKRGQNRTLNMDVARSYRDMVNNGQWRWFDRAQSPMLIDANGIMRSFQHRACGFLMSEKDDFIIPVVHNAHDDEIANQDNGYNRSFIHVVEMFQDIPKTVKLRNKIIPACRVIAEIVYNEPKNANKVAELARAHKESIERIEALCVKNGLGTKYAPVLAAFIWTANYMNTELWEKSFLYFDVGDNSPNPLLHRCREQLIRGEMSSRRSHEVFLKTVCALKAVHQNRESGKLVADTAVLEDW